MTIIALILWGYLAIGLLLAVGCFWLLNNDDDPETQELRDEIDDHDVKPGLLAALIVLMWPKHLWASLRSGR